MKLAELKNPIKAERVNLLSPADWLGSIGFVAWFGFIVALGAKALMAADKLIPGNNTPASYKAAVAETATKGNGINYV